MKSGVSEVDLLIANARVVGKRGGRSADLAVKDGKWVSVQGKFRGRAVEVIEVGGDWVVPGFIDAHVHLNEPGRTRWEGWATGTAALAAGGVTTCFDMPLNSSPPVLSEADVERKRALAQKKASIDFGLWGGLVPGNAGAIEGMAKAGVIGIKAFLCPSGLPDFPASDRKTLLAGARACARAGLVLAVHAEDPEVLAAASAVVTGRDWKAYAASRPERAEVEAVRWALQVASETGSALHVVHVSAPEALRLIHEGRRRGVDVSCETCPHYLILQDEVMTRQGVWAKCAPPLRPKATMEALWRAVRVRLVDTIGSDHSPCLPGRKEGRDFFRAWGGIAGCQHAMPLFWQGADQRGIGGQRRIELTSRNVARRFGLITKRGFCEGGDADAVWLRAGGPFPIREETLLTRHPRTPYAGLELGWKVMATWVRGSLVVRDGVVQEGVRGCEVSRSPRPSNRCGHRF
ncbi:MAG: allantoinase [Candidatus Methylacidiphilales bacterium]